MDMESRSVRHGDPLARWLHWPSVNGTKESHASVEGGGKQKHRTSLGFGDMGWIDSQGDSLLIV